MEEKIFWLRYLENGLIQSCQCISESWALSLSVFINSVTQHILRRVMVHKIMQFWLSAYEKNNLHLCDFESRSYVKTMRLSFSKALPSNSYLYEKLLGHVVTKGQHLSIDCFFLSWAMTAETFNWDLKVYASIHKLTLKNKPTVRTIHCSESEAPLYLYTLWCTYIQALFLVIAARLSSTLVQSSRERQ